MYFGYMVILACMSWETPHDFTAQILRWYLLSAGIIIWAYDMYHIYHMILILWQYIGINIKSLSFKKIKKSYG